MKILISGASGFIGKELCRYLQLHGHTVVKLVRTPSDVGPHAFLWNPDQGEIDLSAFKDVDAVINLSGENISKQWTAETKKKILQSRLQATHTLVQAFQNLEKPPHLFISTSAIGIYEDLRDYYCNEKSPVGSQFLSDVCRQWEEAAERASLKGIRVLIFRLGIVLSSQGGILQKLLPFFRLGLGAGLGSGKQYMSWISIDDLLSIFLFALTNPELGEGIVNVVSPYPVTNLQFTKTLASVLHRPAWWKIPAFLLRFLLGREMANSLLLNNLRVDPLRLKLSGYAFQYPLLKECLDHLINKSIR